VAGAAARDRGDPLRRGKRRGRGLGFSVLRKRRRNPLERARGEVACLGVIARDTVTPTVTPAIVSFSAQKNLHSDGKPGTGWSGDGGLAIGPKLGAEATYSGGLSYTKRLFNGRSCN
jgi:hypothetical protein